MLDAVSLADKARDARDWSRAAELYEAALERHPLRADLLVQRGHALKESGRLAEAEDATVSELAGPLPMSLPAVMKHLDVLEGAGLIARRRGNEIESSCIVCLLFYVWVAGRYCRRSRRAARPRRRAPACPCA